MLTTIIIAGLVVVLLAIAGLVFFLWTKNPSLDRDWSPDQAVMPSIHFLDDDRVRINNIRDIKYRTTRDYDLEFYDRTIRISDVETAWLVIAPFSGWGAAHAFVSFGLNDGTYLAISIEIRRKKGKSFDPVKAQLRQFEIMYVVADERDVIKVRTNLIKYTVRLYPVQSEKHRIQAVFRDMLKRADKLGTEPEFYNTLWNNCTTNLIAHARRFSKKPIPIWDYRYLFPETLDKLAYKLNIIDTHLSFQEAREHFTITEVAQQAENAKDFSKAIRKNIKIRPVE